MNPFFRNENQYQYYKDNSESELTHFHTDHSKNCFQAVFLTLKFLSTLASNLFTNEK